MKQRALPLLLLPLACLAADWPQWRGPQRDDVSRETGLLKSFPENGPRLVVSFEDAGIGYAGVAVVGDRLYSIGGDGEKAAAARAWQHASAPRFDERRAEVDEVDDPLAPRADRQPAGAGPAQGNAAGLPERCTMTGRSD